MDRKDYAFLGHKVIKSLPGNISLMDLYDASLSTSTIQKHACKNTRRWLHLWYYFVQGIPMEIASDILTLLKILTERSYELTLYKIRESQIKDLWSYIELPGYKRVFLQRLFRGRRATSK